MDLTDNILNFTSFYLVTIAIIVLFIGKASGPDHTLLKKQPEIKLN